MHIYPRCIRAHAFHLAIVEYEWYGGLHYIVDSGRAMLSGWNCATTLVKAVYGYYYYFFCYNVNGNNFWVETDAECKHRYAIGVRHTVLLVARQSEWWENGRKEMEGRSFLNWAILYWSWMSEKKLCFFFGKIERMVFARVESVVLVCTWILLVDHFRLYL